jgi:hypothetical protein
VQRGSYVRSILPGLCGLWISNLGCMIKVRLQRRKALTGWGTACFTPFDPLPGARRLRAPAIFICEPVRNAGNYDTASTVIRNGPDQPHPMPSAAAPPDPLPRSCILDTPSKHRLPPGKRLARSFRCAPAPLVAPKTCNRALGLLRPKYNPCV